MEGREPKWFDDINFFTDLNIGTRRKRKTFDENRPSGGGGWLYGGSYVEVKCGESLELLTKNLFSLMTARAA